MIVNSSRFRIEVNQMLQDYCKRADIDLDNILEDIAEESAEKLRQSNEGVNPWKKYPKSWDYKQEKSKSRLYHSYVVYNKKHYRLTHLLEFGHAIRHGGRVVGSADAYPHIANVEEWAIKEAEKRVRDLGD